MSTFFLAMVCTPDVQGKAQQELDSVVGMERLPTIEDMESLPYIQAILLEVARWMPALPMALPHRVLEDDEYKGYTIPRGALVMGVSPSMSSFASIF